MLKVSDIILYYEQRIKDMYIEGVKSSSKYTIKTVMLCMSKVLKEVQNGLTHLYS